MPELPDFGQFSFSLVAAAAAVAAIVLVQGAGVAESTPNPAVPSDANQDFIAQGAGNMAPAASTACRSGVPSARPRST